MVWIKLSMTSEVELARFVENVTLSKFSRDFRPFVDFPRPGDMIFDGMYHKHELEQSEYATVACFE